MIGCPESSESVERKSFTVLVLRSVRSGAFVVGANVRVPGGCGAPLLKSSTIDRLDSLLKSAWRRDRSLAGARVSGALERGAGREIERLAGGSACPTFRSKVGQALPPVNSSRDLGRPVPDRLRVCCCIPPGTFRR